MVTNIEIIIRQYNPSDLDECRKLWVELVEHHRNIYNDPSIGGDEPGLYFDKHLTRVGIDHIVVTFSLLLFTSRLWDIK